MNNVKQFPLDKILIGILAVVVAAVLALFIALSFFNYPAADDFCFAAKARELGFLEAQVFWYEHWSGRYSLNSVWTAIMSSGDIVQIYRYPPVILLVTTWLSFAFLTNRIAQGQVSTSFALLLGGVWTILFIAGAPDPAQTFYWLGGSITYQMANIFLIVLLGLLVWRETTANSNPLRAWLFVFSSLLVIATVGANEVSLLLTGMILGWGTVHALWTKRDSRAFWVGLLLIAIGAALVSVLAPGNYQRYAGIGEDHQLPRPMPWLAMVLYLPWVTLRLLYWLSNLGLWASAFVLLATTFPVARAWLYNKGKFNRRFLILPALWIAAIFILNAPGFLINRYPLPERAESVVWLFFLLGWYPSFIIFAHFLVDEKIQTADHRLIPLAMVLLIISLLGTPNIFEAYKDVYRGYRYDQEMRQRFSTIQAGKNQGKIDIIVDSLSRPPRTLFATDLATDPNNFRNQCMREYYEVKSIKLGTSTK